MRRFCGLFFGVLVGATLSLGPSQAEPFLNFEDIQGKWTGFAWLYFNVAEKERAYCQALIAADGDPNKGTIDWNCDGQTLDLSANVFEIVLNGEKIQGKWSMRSHDVDGFLSGSMTPNSFKARLRPVGQPTDGYGADMTTEIKSKCRAVMTVEIDSPIDFKKMELPLRRC